MLILFAGMALASPFRGPLEKPARVLWEPGRSLETVVVKLRDDVDGHPYWGAQRGRPLIREANPLRPKLERLADDFGLSRLSQYFLFEAEAVDPEDMAEAFNELSWVELAYLGPEPVPPPGDIAPVTPDFRMEQVWLDAAPEGVGHDEAPLWPGGSGSEVAVANLEYSWDKDHEDLDVPESILGFGYDSELYRFHGTAVMGQLFAQDNLYGVTGLVADAKAWVLSPYVDSETYSVAEAIVGAMEFLEEGDVLLIEQQAYFNDSYAPVEVDPMVFDAIAAAVASGIVVVEPTGNGFQDLDSPIFEGLFDREQRDSGAIMVGAGHSPLSGFEPRAWNSQGSCYGERVDVQGWVGDIVTTINEEYDGGYADLFFPVTQEKPEGDGRQAYTTVFGGTSGAAPMVAGVAAIAQSVSIRLHGQPMGPLELRALMVATGTPQPSEDPFKIGPQPDLRRLLRHGLLP